MAQTQVFISEHKGNDKNDGVTPETPVFTAAKAKEVATTIKNPTYSVSGSEPWARRMKAALGISC